MKYLNIFIALIFVSCSVSQTKLSSKGMKVEVLKSKAGSQCSVVEKVVGINDKGSVDLARNHARNLIANAGGNAIHFDEEIVNGSAWRVHSTGYHCK
ncbi:MAG: hypothetical protein KC493_16885 [Bacteriovoracaceae bacterium]|nr:hypothetical protein [Bacteriovoracaceae bacterium]